MVQRSDQQTRSSEFDGIDFDAESSPGSDSTGRFARLSGSGSQLFSPKAFLFAFVLTVVGLFVGGAVMPFFDSIGGLLGILLAGFGLGTIGKHRRYIELALAGALAAGGAFAIGHVTWLALGFGVPLTAVGAGTGLIAAVVGHYLGRDLRDGLTQDI